jgi:penicillin-binding protein 2
MTTSGMAFDDRRSVGLRLSSVQYLVAAIFAALAVAFWYVQVAQHSRFEELAEHNHQRTLALRAPRGVMFDRHGKVLVENRYAFDISLVREETKDLDKSIRLLAGVAGLEEQRVRDVVERHLGEPRYRPIVIVHDATLAQVAAVVARQWELPDVVIEQVPTRHYPTDELAAHLFGYVGEISDVQLARSEYEGLRSGALVGQSGLEQTYNRLLMGSDGARVVVVNSVGREIETLREVDPVEGRRVQLTIDYDLQKAVEDGFKHFGFSGGGVVLDPRTGEVLSLVSVPAYDPNLFTGGIDRANWDALNTDRLRPLQNRMIQGRYSPGSTFKIAVATAALEEGIVTPDFRVNCPGGASFYGRYFRCWNTNGHGSVDMRRAIEQSCNTYFYTLGNMVGIDRLHKWATRLGLGGKTGIDLPHEVEGIMPSTAWKKAKTGERWYAGETISVSIGQGQVSVTPISLAVMMATVANGGTRFTPHLVRAVDEGKGWQPLTPPAPKSVTRMKQSTVDALHQGLWLVVNGAGTGGRARIPGRDVAGKTGTAQVISLQGGRQAAGRTGMDLRDHGWFVFFAPRDNPVLAGAMFAEHAEHGYLAAPIAKHVIETYYARQEGRPLPVLQTQPPPGAAVAAAAPAPAAEPGRPPGT